MRPFVSLAIVGLLVVRLAAFDGPTVRVEHSKPLPKGQGLGTMMYAQTEAEKLAIKDWKVSDVESGSVNSEKLTGNVGKQVAWFGIIREIKEDKDSNTTRLVVEMKYFDGLTDLHLQIVSIYGAGDFVVKIPGIGYKLKPLSLVRIYGTVAAETDDRPEVSAEFVRSWNWKLFAFMPYGTDHSNPDWVKLRKIEDDLDVYDSNPNDPYYEKLLGKRSGD